MRPAGATLYRDVNRMRIGGVWLGETGMETAAPFTGGTEVERDELARKFETALRQAWATIAALHRDRRGRQRAVGRRCRKCDESAFGAAMGSVPNTVSERVGGSPLMGCPPASPTPGYLSAE